MLLQRLRVFTDWYLVVSVVFIMLLGLVTMVSFDDGVGATLIFKQSIFITLAVAVMLIGSFVSPTLLRGPLVSLSFFLIACTTLVALLLFADTINGAKSWFTLGPFVVQPVEFIKLLLIIVLARYFAGRHMHIRHIRHVVVSLALAGSLFFLVFMQPDLGSSVILLAIWAGMIFVSGVSKRHIAALLIAALLCSLVGWQFLSGYQKERILDFLQPLQNLTTTGYSAHQSVIAVGSGELLGKGVGEGTQSELGFLPLHESDFIFAAYAEEWGFFGVLLLFALYGLIAWRLYAHAVQGRTNFETLVVVGVFVFFFSHFVLHIGVNVALLPVTGITLPFMSYGGSHLLAEACAIALVLSMARLERP